MPTLNTATMTAEQPLRAFIYDRNSRVINGRTTSTEDQRTENRRLCERNGWTIVGEFCDPGRSASRFAVKAREDYERMLEGIRRGECDVVVIWEASRGYRSTKTFVELRDLLAERRVTLCYNGREYDMANRSDRFMTLIDAGRAEDEADAIRDRILRTTRLNAERGGVHGRIAFGFRRVYDEHTGRLVAQVPDESQAPVVVEAAERIAAGQTLRGIIRDFKGRGLPEPDGGWIPQTLAYIVMRPSNVGLREHKGVIVGEGSWEPIFKGEAAVAVYYAAVAVLSDPARRTQRDTNIKYLLSGIALCGPCGGGGRLRRKRDPRGTSRLLYTCEVCYGVSITMATLDDFVQASVLKYVERPQFAASLRAPAGGGTAAALVQARALEEQLAELRRLAATFENGRFRLSAVSLADAEARLLPQIEAARQRAQDASVPLVLRRLAGAGAREIWSAMDVHERRAAIRALTTVTLNRVGKGVHEIVPGRVAFGWLR